MIFKAKCIPLSSETPTFTNQLQIYAFVAFLTFFGWGVRRLDLAWLSRRKTKENLATINDFSEHQPFCIGFQSKIDYCQPEIHILLKRNIYFYKSAPDFREACQI